MDFDRIKNTAYDMMRKAKKTSRDAYEISRLKIKLSDVNYRIDTKFKEIGSLVYNSENYEEITDKLNMISGEIDGLKSTAESIETSIDELTNKISCPKCNARVNKTYSFCPKCGCDINTER